MPPTFVECYTEVMHSFPASSPTTLKSFATRLHRSLFDEPKHRMDEKEFKLRTVQLATALESMSDWPGDFNPEKQRRF